MQQELEKLREEKQLLKAALSNCNNKKNQLYREALNLHSKFKELHRENVCLNEQLIDNCQLICELQEEIMKRNQLNGSSHTGKSEMCGNAVVGLLSLTCSHPEILHIFKKYVRNPYEFQDLITSGRTEDALILLTSFTIDIIRSAVSASGANQLDRIHSLNDQITNSLIRSEELLNRKTKGLKFNVEQDRGVQVRASPVKTVGPQHSRKKTIIVSTSKIPIKRFTTFNS